MYTCDFVSHFVFQMEEKLHAVCESIVDFDEIVKIINTVSESKEGGFSY